MLRKSPDDQSEGIIKLEGELFEIKPLNERNHNWSKVKVRKYKEHPCRSYNRDEILIEFELEGWIKIVNEKGIPNVWYYPRGC